jgi:hydrogenase maturation protein HypF
VAFDGTGYGDDGNTWGAELLYANLTGYRRMGHLRYAPLPGGDIAARAPWRVALGYLSLEPSARAAFGSAFTDVPSRTLRVAEQSLVRQINAPLASSMGRLFDAAAAVIGVRRESQYEGQAAMELEALAGRAPGAVLPYAIGTDDAGRDQLDPLPLLIALGEQARAGRSWQELAAAFHETVVHATVAMVTRAADACACRVAALGGGCFQNARLLAGLTAALREAGYTVLAPRQLSPNDGAVSFGQAAVAAARLSQALPQSTSFPQKRESLNSDGEPSARAAER